MNAREMNEIEKRIQELHEKYINSGGNITSVCRRIATLEADNARLRAEVERLAWADVVERVVAASGGVMRLHFKGGDGKIYNYRFSDNINDRVAACRALDPYRSES